MTVPVPVTLPTTAGWSVGDWLDQSWTSPPAGPNGVATITFDPVPDNARWQLTHMVAECSSVAASQLRLYLDGTAPVNLRDGTTSGNFDVADWPLGLWVPPGRSLIAQWTSADPGAVGVLTLQATIYRRSS